MIGSLARAPMIRRRLVAVLLTLMVGGLTELAASPVEAGYPRRLTRRPRASRHPHYQAPSLDRESFVHLKFGAFDPDGARNGGGFFGLSTGVEFQNRVTAGFTADFYRRSFTDEAIIAESVDENGNVITTTVRRLDTSSNLIPLGVALGFRLPGSRTVTPFVGVGVAYEVLVNEVRNYELGIEDTNVYSGPGWQLFGGLLVPVSSDVRLMGELWANDATVSREIDRYERGLPVSERIEVDGFGARLGVEFHFD